jgi:hypothetical protein
LALPQSPSDVRFGDSPQENFGSAVCSITDFDGDGLEDFAVGVPCDNQRGPLSGSVKVYGRRPSIERLNLIGDAPGDLFGSALARIPDVDCDGIDDLLVGAPGSSFKGRSAGQAILYSGADARILLRLWGQLPGDEFGAAVCAVGDLNGDGISEIAVGAPGARTNGRSSGSVVVFDPLDARIIFSFHGDSRGERFGTSLAGAGDMDGDGLPELAVGAPCPRLDRPGYARVFAGADASVLYTFGGRRTWELFGSSLAGVGDVDGDGYGDLLVGAPASRPGEATIEDARGHACGAATLFSGASGTPLFLFTSDESEDRLGSAVAAGPDLDGDGIGDLLVGASQRLRPRAGYVRAYSSRSGALLATWTGLDAGDQFGAALAVLRSQPNKPARLAIGAPTDSFRGFGVGSVALVEL